MWWIVLVVIAVLIVVLAVGGMIGRQRQLARTQGRFDTHLSEVNHDLAQAHAADRGWTRELLAAAAHAAYEAERGKSAEHLELIQIVDRPGTDDDKAVYSVADGPERLTLGRRGDDWVFESLK